MSFNVDVSRYRWEGLHREYSKEYTRGGFGERGGNEGGKPIRAPCHATMRYNAKSRMIEQPSETVVFEPNIVSNVVHKPRLEPLTPLAKTVEPLLCSLQKKSLLK